MIQEDKAKAYDEVVNKLRRFMAQGIDPLITRADVQDFFPELKESEDEKMIESMTRLVKAFYDVNFPTPEGFTREEMLAWLEKQKSVSEIVERCKNSWYNEGKIDGMAKGLTDDEKYQQGWHDALEKQGENSLVNFDEAEKEKYDFVSGQYIECRASFNEFKEDNSYWLEYIGNDTYIGRSDNILNQKFHITPRQLYCLFTQQHCPKEDNTNNETNAPTEYGKYVDECLNEASKHFFSEGEDTYSVADLFYAGVRCGKSWLEKQKEQSIISHKFNAGDWIVSKWGGIYQIKEVMSGSYNLLCTNNAEEINSITQVDNNSRLLCISDIKKLEKQGEQKPTWNEEDEEFLRRAINAAKDAYPMTAKWLKSLKDRYTWKPSDEQMADLYTMVCECRSADHQLLQDLYYGLKTLRGE